LGRRKTLISLIQKKENLRFLRSSASKMCFRLITDNVYYTIHNLEPIMINKFRPIINRTYNLSPSKDTTPKSKKEMDFERYVDKSYDEIFNQKDDKQ